MWGEAHVFDAFYPVHGVIDAGGCPTPNPLAGKKVVFYQSYPTYVADDVINTANGEYIINIFDNIEVEIDPNVTYYIAVENAADGWGADPVEVHITYEGWNRVDLTLADGAGPSDGNTEGPDDGLINGTEIERFNGHVRLHWLWNGAANADIWRYDAGSNGEFSATGSYTHVHGPTTNTEWEDTGVNVGNGENYFYRVVPGGTAQGDIMNGPLNRRTMGKVDVRLRDEYNSISYPFNAGYIDVLTLMGDQLVEGDQIHWWDQPNQAYGLITRATNDWPNTHNFQFAEGLFIYLVPEASPRDVNLTLVGLVGNFATGISIPMGEKYKLFGYPYPVVRDAKQIGLRQLEADQIHMWTWAEQGFGLTTFVNVDWDDVSLIDLSLGEGKFFYTPIENTAFDWDPIF